MDERWSYGAECCLFFSRVKSWLFSFHTFDFNCLSSCFQVLLFAFVGLTLVITYLKVLCTAQAVSGSNQESARNARNTILLHGVQLLICMLSFFSPLISVILVTTWPSDRTKILLATFLFTHVLPRLLSPLIYGVRDKKFRSHIRLLLCCNCCSSEEKKINRVGTQQRSKEVLQWKAFDCARFRPWCTNTRICFRNLNTFGSLITVSQIKTCCLCNYWKIIIEFVCDFTFKWFTVSFTVRTSLTWEDTRARTTAGHWRLPCGCASGNLREK